MPEKLGWKLVPVVTAQLNSGIDRMELEAKEILKEAKEAGQTNPSIDYADDIFRKADPRDDGGSMTYSMSTPGDACIFINEATVDSGPLKVCTWRQVIESTYLKVVRSNGKSESMSGQRMTRPNIIAGVDQSKGADGAEQDWGPLTTNFDKVTDLHVTIRPQAIRLMHFFAMFKLQSVPPNDKDFSKEDILCKRWWYTWTASEKRGVLTIVVYDTTKGQFRCKAKLIQDRDSAPSPSFVE